MSDPNVCLICLCKGVKMYDYNKYKLKLYYEEVMALKMIDGLPQHFCYLCAATLYKFHKFKEKCHIGQQILKELLSCGPITSASISQVDRKIKHLQTPLGVMKPSKRVKTYTLSMNTSEKAFIDSPKVEPKDDFRTEYSSDQSHECKNDCKMEVEVELSNVVELKVNVDEQKIKVDEQKVNVKIQNTSVDRGKTKIHIQNLNEEWNRAFSDLDDSRHATETDKSNPEVQNVAVHKQDITLKTTTAQGQEKMRKQVKVVKKNEKIIDKTIKKDNITKAKRNAQQNQAKREKYKCDKGRMQELDPKHWLIINMSEQEAMDSFKARSEEPRYKTAAYKCTQCYTAFSKQDILSRHIQLVHNESRGPFECHFCCRRFDRNDLLKKHKPVHYHKFKCLRCDHFFQSLWPAVKHNDYHNGFLKKCEQCSLEFRHLTTYYSHLRIYHRSEHVCTLCGASFVSQKGLQQHKNLKHINTDVNPDEAGANTYCEKCDIKFGTRQAYDEHFGHSTKHAEVVPPTEPTVQDEDDMPDTEIPDNTTLKRKVATLDMQRHRKSARATTCFVCKKLFASYTRYKKHHRDVHKNIPIPEIYSQMCEVCGAIIKGANLAIHMNTHTRENSYPCPTCGMKFTLKGNMYRHIETQHTVRAKPVPIHKCPLCDKRYTEKGNMTVHYRTVHLKQPHRRRNRKIPKEEAKDDED